MRLSASSVSAKEHSPTVIRSSTPPTISDSFKFLFINTSCANRSSNLYIGLSTLTGVKSLEVKEWIMMNMFISVDRCIDIKS